MATRRICSLVLTVVAVNFLESYAIWTRPVVKGVQFFDNRAQDTNFTKFEEEIPLTFSSDNEAEFHVPTGVFRLYLNCMAPYPVSWRLGSLKYGSLRLYGSIGTHQRVAKDPFDHTTFNYSAGARLHEIGNQMTGRYICRCERNQSLTTSVYVYWPGANAGQAATQQLILSKKNITLSLEEASKKSLVFPCFVSMSNVTAVLYKYTAKGRIQVQLDDNVVFDPKVGFTLTNVPNPEGYYRCFTTKTDWDEDYVGITVPEQPDSQPANWTSDPLPPASIYVDYSKQSIICCSGSDQAPKTYDIVCEHPITCEYYSKAVPANIEYLHHFRKGYSRQTKQRGCSIVNLKNTNFITGGVVRCIGPGFDKSQNYIYSLSGANTGPGAAYHASYDPNYVADTTPRILWSSWNEIEPEELIRISIRKNHYGTLNSNQTNAVIFTGQSFSVQCITSPYYFARGLHWVIKYKNGSMRAQDNEVMRSDYHGGYGYPPIEPDLYLIASEDMDSIICMVPVWNSSVWVNKVFHPYVNQSQIPQLNMSEESIKWRFNETQKTITCNATGFPLPTIYWIKNYTTLANSTNMRITERLLDNGTVLESNLTFVRVSHLTQGSYLCEVKNVGGVVKRNFTVEVIEVHNWNHTGLIVFCVLGGLILLAVIGFLGWKIKEGAISLRTLSDGFVRNSEEVDNSIPYDVNNHAFDPSRLNGDLLGDAEVKFS